MKKKAAARFFGMKGGRFAEAGAENGWIFELHNARLRELRKGPRADEKDKHGGQWPQQSLDEWRRIAAVAQARPEGVSPTPREAMALDVVAAADEGGWP